MKKTLIYLFAALITSCSNDIEPTDASNKTSEILFSVPSLSSPLGGNEGGSRAVETYIPWSADKHANTLGVFGYADASTVIFNNQKVTYNADKWQYTPAKFWIDYNSSTAFDFFGYMVEESDLPSSAALSSTSNTRTLSFPASITSPILISADNTPLICHVPHHTTATGDAIPFKMDQTLTGYTLEFKLGDKMSTIRHFVIKKVEIYGNDLPVSGTVSRTYTQTGDTWTSGSIKWTDISVASVTEDVAKVVASEWANSATKEQRTVSKASGWVKWGGSTVTDGAIYVIPHADFKPTIVVTYDVYTNNGETLSRKDITSNIILNDINFPALAAGTTGEIQTIKIQIVPDNLYVLADDDITSGILVVGE